MKKIKICLQLILLVFFISTAFGIGVYDNNGDFIHYVSNLNPQIKINITSGESVLKVNEGIVNIDGDIYEYPKNIFIDPFMQKEIIFDISQDISQAQNIYFNLSIINNLTMQKVNPQGDRVNFAIKFDNSPPKLIKIENNIKTNGKIVFEFDKPIHFLDLYVNDVFVLKKYNVINSMVLNQKYIEVDFSGFSFPNELNIIKIDFEDLAGNFGSNSSEIFIAGDPLNIKLLTLRDDNSLKYNYNKEYLGLFNGTIYKKEDDMSFKIKTNKPSDCYFSSSLTSFMTFGDVISKTKFTSEDSLSHSIALTKFDDEIWVACQNKHNPLEIVYLSDFMGFNNKLIQIEKYSGSILNINFAQPDSIVSNVPFSVYVDTNNRAVCSYNIDNGQKVLLDTTNYINHEKNLVTALAGLHSIKFECIDVLDSKITKTNMITIDTNIGVKVTYYSPQYTSISLASVNITLSESMDVVCKYSLEQVSTSKFATLENISGTGILRNFNLNSLTEGINDIFIYCSKNSQISDNKITIIYDTKGVILSNFSFVNGNYYSDFTLDTDKLSFRFDVESLIPIKKYIARVEIGNETIEQSISSNSATLYGDFTNATQIMIIAINGADVNSTITKQVKFDFSEPVVSFFNDEDGKKIMCIDHESSCSDVFYGFSQTSIDCHANIKYNNTALNTTDKNYICARAFNFVNLDSYIIESLGNNIQTVSNQTKFDDFFIDDDKNNESDFQIDDDKKDIDYDPFDPTSGIRPDDDSGGYILIAAFVLVFAGIFGGGFYAYKKGYLNKELEKLGIKIPTKKSENKINNSSSGVKFTSKPIEQKIDDEKLKKPGYDKHLKKINDFIDTNISKSQSVFDKFKTTEHKGKVKGYNDTLIKGEKSSLNKEDFDEFYAKSDNSKKEFGVKKSLEKEAESFEEYYKNKKKTDSKK